MCRRREEPERVAVLRLRKNAKRLGCQQCWPRVSIRWPHGWAPIALYVGDGFIILLGTLTGHQPTNTPGVASSSIVPSLPCVPQSSSQRFLRSTNQSAHAILGYNVQVIGTYGCDNFRIAFCHQLMRRCIPTLCLAAASPRLVRMALLSMGTRGGISSWDYMEASDGV